ncbi:MAG: hypothetical protein AAFR38_00790 [Planctomycetota bacterium]
MRTAASIAVVTLAASGVAAQTFLSIANSGAFDFVKEPFGTNVDELTELVTISRGVSGGMASTGEVMWLFGTTIQEVEAQGPENFEFAPFFTANQFNPPSIVDQPGVLFLVDENIYLEINFTVWQAGGGNGSVTGGGVEYTRAVIPAPGGAAVLGLTGLVATRRRR